jgi:DNA (cytosine-5)-methyltransferase 1
MSGVKVMAKKLLDLFCGVGGASVGYAQAGFEVHGVDLKHGKRYPYTYLRADVLEVLRDEEYLQQFDVIHASPPCQTHSITKHLRNAQGKSTSKVDLIPETRAALIATGKPYIIENVMGSPLIDPIMLCGSAFGLKVRRHRIFESNLKLQGTTCNHKEQGRPVGVYGSLRDEIPKGGKTAESIDEARQAMDMPWAIWSELVEAIPPAYTKYLGEQIVWDKSHNIVSQIVR